MSKPLVLVGMVSNRGIRDLRTLHSLMTLEDRARHAGVWLGFVTRNNTFLCEGRNQMLDAVLETPATHFLSIDDDGTWPEDIIPRLLAHQKPIVAGLTFQRGFPYRPALWSMDSNTVIEDYTPGLQTRPDLAVGMHATLIEVEVFRKLADWYGEREWFALQGGGEDDYFCRRVRAMYRGMALKLGACYTHPIWLDVDCKCGHLPSDQVVTEELYLAARRHRRS